MAEINDLIVKYALQNALKHNAAPNANSVMGKLLGENSELRSRAREISPIIRDVLSELEKVSPDEWKKRLEAIAPELMTEISIRKEPNRSLPALKGVQNGVVMRFAPNPNGPPTIGSARGIIINSEYVKIYGGKFILRFDDTDPIKKQPLLEAYDWYVEDCEWLGAKPDQIITASKRIDKYYYPIAEELILRGGAYVCLCDQGTFKVYKDKGIPCRHRNQSPEKNFDLWNMMLNGQLKEGEAVLRIKTDMSNPSHALRDWPAARSVLKPHPLVGNKYHVWPMLDFESAIEDHVLGITHILRGKDLADSEKRQIYLYKHMGWDYPIVVHWGIIKDLGWTKPRIICKKQKEKKSCRKIFQFGSFSTSMLRKAISMKEYTGWDDPRVPSVRAFRRRGIRPEALRKVLIELGMAETDICINMDSIYAENRKLIDPEVNRYFFVWDPVELELEGEIPSFANAPLHPNINRGFRKIPAGKKIFICKSDLSLLGPGDKIRLKYLCNIELISKKLPKARFIGTELDRAIRIIHWVPKNGIPIKVLKPDGIDKGIGESGIERELNNVVQFERYGFARIYKIDNLITAYYGHR